MMTSYRWTGAVELIGLAVSMAEPAVHNILLAMETASALDLHIARETNPFVSRGGRQSHK